MDEKRKVLLDKVAKLISDYEFSNGDDGHQYENVDCLIFFDYKEEYIYMGNFELKTEKNIGWYRQQKED